jgi:cytochrome P450
VRLADFDLNAIGPDFIADPHPVLDALREERPLHRNPDGSILLTRYEDCRAVYQSRAMLSDKTEAFTAKFGESPLKEHHTTSLVFNDPPYHTTVRKLLAEAFTPRKLAEFEPLIARIVARLLDRLEDMGEADIVEDFAKVLPTEIISVMLGVPEEMRPRLRGYSLAILGALDPVVSPERLEAGNRAVEEFSALLAEIIDHRRRNPGQGGEGEVLEALIFGEHDGRRLTERELIQNCIFLLNAGHETTTSFVANAAGTLFAAPDAHRELRDDPGLIGSGVVPKGSYVHLSVAGANRDPRVFDAPHEVRLARSPNRHLAFVTGIHVCLGATLSRIEGRIAVGGLVSRFPGLAPNGEGVRLPLARFRGWAKLPVRVR